VTAATAAEQLEQLDRLRGNPRPRIETPPGRGRTLGRDLSALADAIGVPLMPWQRHVANRALTIDGAGRWVHRTAGVVVARQNGKTHLLRLRILAGLYLWDERLIVATAQNREIALETFRAVVEAIESTPWLAAEVRSIRKANGQEAVELTNGARYRIVAPTAAGSRGLAAVDLAVIDEAREHRTDSAYASLVYTTQASRNPQVWLTSNAGDAGSVVLNRLRQQALRAIAVPGSDPTVGYWEWSAADGCDLDDPAAWSQANPALGHTITADTLAARIRSDPPQVVRTELLCQWVDTMDSPWPPNAWAACTTDGLELQADRDTVLALDVSPDRRTAALVAVQAAEDGDQLDAVLVDTWHADGAVDDLTIATEVAEVAEQLDARLVAYDRYTASAVAQRLQRAGVAVAEVSGPLFVQACDQLLTAMVTGRLRHPGQAALTDHVLAAARKPAADGGWRIVRARSAGPIPAAVALAMAVHHALDGGGAEPVVMFA